VALNRGGVVGHPEDHRLHPLRAGGGDLVDVDHPDRGLDQHGQPDLPPETHGGLDLGEQCRDDVHVARPAHLGNDDRVDGVAGLLDHVHDVAIAPVRVEPVDAHRQRAPRPVLLPQRVDDVDAGLLLVVGRHGVLEVEHGHIGPEARRFLQHAYVAPGDRQLAPVKSGFGRHHPGQ
jgi:hypothetical protein